ncbi:MAG: hypothetical protein HY515_03880 [Candidatus Aenigmarchaeota archaeon]|nr:hypothetical protein [Candidatus Aenigmarchaeota archaeon]
MKKGVASVVASVILLLGSIALIGIAYAWFSGTLERVFNGSLYPQVEDFCASNCIIDSDKTSRIIVPLDANTVVQAKVVNTAGVGKTYTIAYYPNFTPELSLVATTPTVFVPALGTAFAEVTVKGLIARSNEINFNITTVNVNDNKDNMSFGIRSSVSTSNVPDISMVWFLIILSVSSAAIYLKSR